MKNKKHISKHPFKTPDNYFSKLTEDISQSVQGEYVPQNIKSISKDSIYSTPKNYFDDLPLIIQTRLQKKNRSTWTTNWKPILAPALAALFIIGFFLFKPLLTPQPTAEELLSTISSEELLAYIDIEELNNDEILDLVGDSDIEFETNITNDLQLDEETFHELNISEIDDLDDYFIDVNMFENINPEDLL